MQFTSLAALALSVLSAEALIAFTHTPGANVTAGQTFTITWDGAVAGSPVTITLKRGDPNNLQTVALLTGNGMNGSFDWTPDTSLQNGDNYALEISQGTGYDETNYSGEFAIMGGSNSSSSSSSSSSGAGPTGVVVVTITSGTTSFVTTEPAGMTGSASGMGNATMSSNMTVTHMTPTSTGGIQITPPSTTTHASSSSSSGAAATLGLLGGVGGMAAALAGVAVLL